MVFRHFGASYMAVRKRAYLVVLLLLLSAAAILFYSRYALRSTHIPTRTLTLTSRQITLELAKFLDSLATRPQTPESFGMHPQNPHTGNQGTPVSQWTYDGSPVSATAKLYDDLGTASLDTTGSSPQAISAWRLLGLSAIYQVTKDEKFYEQVLLNYYVWVRHTNGMAELNVLHQLYEAAQITRHPGILNFFFDRSLFLKSYVESTLPSSPPRSVRGLAAPTAAIYARQLALAAKALREPWVAKLLTSNGNFPRDEVLRNSLADEFVTLARRTLIAAVTSAIDSPSALVEGVRDGYQFSCLTQWVNLAIYAATKRDEDLEKVVSYFDRLDLPNRASTDVHFSSMHEMLSCAHTLQELSTIRPEFSSYYRHLIEQFILPNWDFRQRPLCDGDNGLFANVTQKPATAPACSGRVKTDTDAAWLAFILSRTLTEYVLR